MSRNSLSARVARGLSRALLSLLALLLIGWACLALWLDGPSSRPIAALLAGALGLVGIVALVRPRRNVVVLGALLWLVVLGWWLSIPASNDRDWQADVARLPGVTRDGDTVTVRNVRDFEYASETDYQERWEDRTYDLSKVRGVDMFISYWGPTLIAHTIMSWEFEDGRHLAVSIETRKEKGEMYSAVRGLFRQYELYYVVADERDVVGLRTNHRGEQVFLYRLRASPAQARAALEAYLKEIDHFNDSPVWYNAFSHNCTTSIRGHVQQAGVHNPWNWRVLANGKGDELLYSRGAINTSVPFAELRAASDITAKAKAADGDPSFSNRIREGLLPRPISK